MKVLFAYCGIMFVAIIILTPITLRLDRGEMKAYWTVLIDTQTMKQILSEDFEELHIRDARKRAVREAKKYGFFPDEFCIGWDYVRPMTHMHSQYQQMYNPEVNTYARLFLHTKTKDYYRSATN